MRIASAMCSRPSSGDRFYFLVEALFAVFIYFTLDERQSLPLRNDTVFCFSFSVSAFCNAGFSLLRMVCMDVHYRFNYPFLLIISFLVITGGLGFNIIFNFFRYLEAPAHQAVEAIVYPQCGAVQSPHHRSTHQTRHHHHHLSAGVRVHHEPGAGILIIHWKNTAPSENWSPHSLPVLPREQPASIPLTWVHCFLPPSSSISADADRRIAGPLQPVVSRPRPCRYGQLTMPGERTVEVFSRELSIGSLRRACVISYHCWPSAYRFSAACTTRTGHHPGHL